MCPAFTVLSCLQEIAVESSIVPKASQERWQSIPWARAAQSSGVSGAIMSEQDAGRFGRDKVLATNVSSKAPDPFQ